MCRKHNEISPAILHVLHYYLKDQHHETGYDFNIFSLDENNVKNIPCISNQCSNLKNWSKKYKIYIICEHGKHKLIM